MLVKNFDCIYCVPRAEAEKKIDQSEREYQRKRIEDAIGTSMKSKAKVSKAEAQSIDDILNEIR